MDQFDICIVGGGVIGLAIAQAVAKKHKADNYSILLLERNTHIGQEISSRSSEVIHAGIYYPKNSLKARLCVEGKQLLYEHCAKYNVPHRKIGKFIVANHPSEYRLQELLDRAETNNVLDLNWCTKELIKRKEPNIAADHALFSPSTGIIDSHAYMQSLLYLAQTDGVCFTSSTNVRSIETDCSSFIISTLCDDGRNKENYQFSSRFLINAAGLSAQELAGNIIPLAKESIPRLYLCKGNYFTLKGKTPFSHLVYPIPEKRNEGLGVHATLDLSGQVRFGPDVEYIDTIDYTVNQQCITNFYDAIRQYYPDLKDDTLVPAYAGIRPKLQALGGESVDFSIQTASDHGIENLIQLFGIESPGLTASLAIGKYVAEFI